MHKTAIPRGTLAPERDNLYPIRTLSQLTGVNPVTLRAWERRYGLIKPSRTESGHRVYSSDNVDVIRQVLLLLEDGMSIGQVGSVLRARRKTPDVVQSRDPWREYQRRMLARVQEFDELGLDQVYNDAVAVYPVDIVTVRFIVPLLKELELRWQQGTGTIAEERFFSTYLRNKLGARFHHRARLTRGPTLILACLPHEHHEIGLLLLSLSALDHGFRLVLLGADLPLTDIPGVCARTGCAAVILSGSADPVGYDLAATLAAVVDEVPVPVFVGGGVTLQCWDAIEQAGARALGGDVPSALGVIPRELGTVSEQR